jgi:RNA polymerase sigma factor (sigma-70 family)
VSVSGGSVENSEEALSPLNDMVVKSLLESRKSFEGFLRRHVPNAEIAEDLFQQGLLKALTNPEPLKNPESMVPWFYRILRNALIDFYRARGSEDRKNEAFLQELLGDETQALVMPPEVEASICACLKDLIPSLKPEYASLIQKIDLDGKPMGDVSAELGISSNNLAVRLHRARQALRTSLIRCCGACTEHGCLNCTCKKAD